MSSFWNAIWWRISLSPKGLTVTPIRDECPWFLQTEAKSSVHLISFHLNSLYCLWPRSRVSWSATKSSCKCSLLWRRSHEANMEHVCQRHWGLLHCLPQGSPVALEKGLWNPLYDKARRCCVSSLGRRALALPCSRPAALSRPPLLEQRTGFHGSPDR